MTSSSDFSQYASAIKQANTALIILGNNSSFDQQLAASSLFLSLQQQGKRVNLLSPKEIKNPTISGLDQLKTEIGNKNLVISFDYVETAVQNVSYHIDEDSNKFYLTIKPQADHDPLNKDAIKTEYAGADSDIIIIFGVEELDDLDQLYFGYEALFKDTTILAISKFKPRYESLAIDSSEFSSDSEVVFGLLKNMGAELSSELATNLLAGIQYQTNNFIDPKAGADTFEAVAQLIRSGAQRKAGSFSFNNHEPEVKMNGMDANHDQINSNLAKQKTKEVEIKFSDSASVNKQPEKNQSDHQPRPSGLKR